MENIKLLNSKTDLSQKWDGGKLYDDFDKLKEKLGNDPFSKIKNIKIKKVWVLATNRVWGLRFDYQITTNDNNIQQIIGYQSPETFAKDHGAGNDWKGLDVTDGDYIIKIKGNVGWDTDGLQFNFLNAEPQTFGSYNNGTYEVENPALFFTRVDNASGVRTIGFYSFSPDLKEVKRLEIEKGKYLKIADEWSADFKADFGSIEKPLISVEGMKAVKAKLTQLTTDKATAEKERDATKTNLNDLTEEWNTDFQKDFDNKELSVGSLKLVKEKLKNQANDTPKPINDYWGNNFKEFGDKLDIDTLTKIKDKLKTLEAENTKLDNAIKTLSKNKEDSATEKNNLEAWLKERNKTIGELNDELRKRNKTIDERQNTIGELNTENEKLTTEKNNLEQKLAQEKEAAQKLTGENKDLKDKNKDLQDQVNSLTQEKNNSDKYKKELLDIYIRETKSRLTAFYQEMSIDSEVIIKKYENDEEYKKKYTEKFDYENFVEKKMTLENRKDLIEAFKVVSCICATEKAKKLDGEFKNKTNLSENLIEHLLNNFRKVKKSWNETSKTVNKENNPFYLSIIEKQQESRNELEQLISEWSKKQANVKAAQLHV